MSAAPLAVMTPQARLLLVAVAEIGYHEKASNADLDSKTGNSGSANYTKYARDLDSLGNIYNGRKQGYDWCDVYVDTMFVMTFGVELAMKLLCQPYKGCGAGCKYSMGYYQAKGQFHKTGPQPGDQIFFGDANSTWHTGIVEKSQGGYVYTIEGNTGNGSVQVERCAYSLNYKYIKGYGRPDWSLVSSTHLTGWQGYVANTGDEGLNCRTYPTSGTVIKTFPENSTLTIIQELNGWGLVESQGWVSLGYVNKGTPAPAPTPPEPTPTPGGDDDMDQAKFNQMFTVAMEAYRTTLQDNDSCDYSEAARKWAIEKGIVVGGGNGPDGQPNYMWADFMTREQAVTILYRTAVALGLA